MAVGGGALMPRPHFTGEATLSYVLGLPEGGLVALHIEGDFAELAKLSAGQKVRLVVSPAVEEKPRHTLARAAGILCRDRTFVRWLMGTFPGRWQALRAESDAETAARVVRMVCGVQSRSELDGNERAAFEFHRQIRKPYHAWLAENRAILGEFAA